MNGFPDIAHSYSAELARKSIHLSSLSIPVGYWMLDKGTALSVLIPLTAAFALTDLARIFLPSIGSVYHRWFGWLLRPAERDPGSRRLNGATYVLLSACICIWVFPKVVAITAFTILIISDTLAALVGRRFGKRPLFAKTLEGTLTFLISAIGVVAFTPKITHAAAEYLVGMGGAVVGTAVESISGGLDDNLTIPIAVGAAMWILYALVLPSVNVFGLDTL